MEGENSSILFKSSEKNMQFGADADISMTEKYDEILMLVNQWDFYKQ